MQNTSFPSSLVIVTNNDQNIANILADDEESVHAHTHIHTNGNANYNHADDPAHYTHSISSSPLHVNVNHSHSPHRPHQLSATLPLDEHSAFAVSNEDLEVVSQILSPTPSSSSSNISPSSTSNAAHNTDNPNTSTNTNSNTNPRTSYISADAKRSMDLSSFGSVASPTNVNKPKLASSISATGRLGSFSLKRRERKDSSPSATASSSPRNSILSTSSNLPTSNSANSLSGLSSSLSASSASSSSASSSSQSSSSNSTNLAPETSNTKTTSTTPSSSSKFSFGSFLRQVTSLTSTSTNSNSNSSLSPTSAREAAHEQHKKEWLQLLASGQSYTDAKIRARCIKLAFHGIPSSVRPDAWKFIIGNQLNITEDLFWIMMGRAQEVKEIKALKQAQRDQQEAAEAAAALAATTLSDTSSNNSDTTSSSSTPSSSANTTRITSAGEKANKESSVALIDTDVSRTFAELKFFHDGGPLQAPLFQVLEAFGCYRPDVGYVQGMSYLAAMLLLNLDTLDAFIALCNLLNQEMYFKFYRMNAAQMSIHMKAFSLILHDQLPQLAAHFQSIGISADMFLYEWLLTIFSRSLALDVTHRIWDNFLCQGHVFLFRVALALLRMQQAQFLEASFEDCLESLHHPPKTFDVDVFFNEHLNKISLSEDKLHKILAISEKSSAS